MSPTLRALLLELASVADAMRTHLDNYTHGYDDNPHCPICREWDALIARRREAMEALTEMGRALQAHKEAA